MIGTTSLFVLEQDCDEIARKIERHLMGAGMSVERTFDLQTARAAHTDCPCPHHGTIYCNCQLVVLLVGDGANRLTTLVAHGHDGKCWLSLADTLKQRADPGLMETIKQALVSEPVDFRETPMKDG